MFTEGVQGFDTLPYDMPSNFWPFLTWDIQDLAHLRDALRRPLRPLSARLGSGNLSMYDGPICTIWTHKGKDRFISYLKVPATCIYIYTYIVLYCFVLYCIALDWLYSIVLYCCYFFLRIYRLCPWVNAMYRRSAICVSAIAMLVSRSLTYK